MNLPLPEQLQSLLSVMRENGVQRLRCESMGDIVELVLADARPASRGVAAEPQPKAEPVPEVIGPDGRPMTAFDRILYGHHDGEAE